MHFNTVQNHYEKLVYERVATLVGRKTVDNNYLEDVACVALNHLPPRYIRYEVDMFFYLSPVEREEMITKVENAIKNAVIYIQKNKTRRK